MTSFEILLNKFTSIEEGDFNGFLAAKSDTLLGYMVEIPRLVNILKALFAKVIVADGVLDAGEIASVDLLDTIFKGKRLDYDKFIAGMTQFVKDGADVSEAIGAYWMLPEYIRDDIVFFLFVVSTVDGEVAKEELEFISTLCE